MEEGILRFVVRRANWLAQSDHINNGCSRCNVQDFHAGVIQRVERREQVEVPRYKDDQEQLMRSDRDTCPQKEISQVFISPAMKVRKTITQPRRDPPKATMSRKERERDRKRPRAKENATHDETKQMRN